MSGDYGEVLDPIEKILEGRMETFFAEEERQLALWREQLAKGEMIEKVKTTTKNEIYAYIRDEDLLYCIRCDGSYEVSPLQLGADEGWSCKDIVTLIEELDYHGLAYKTYDSFCETEGVTV